MTSEEAKSAPSKYLTKLKAGPHEYHVYVHRSVPLGCWHNVLLRKEVTDSPTEVLIDCGWNELVSVLAPNSML